MLHFMRILDQQPTFILYKQGLTVEKWEFWCSKVVPADSIMQSHLSILCSWKSKLKASESDVKITTTVVFFTGWKIELRIDSSVKRMKISVNTRCVISLKSDGVL